MNELLRTLRLMAPLAIAIGVNACVEERPVPDEVTEGSRALSLLAADCRAKRLEGGAIEAGVSIIDFGEGDPELELVWSIDGSEVSVSKEPRPTMAGTPLKYRLKRSLTHSFERPGLHRIGLTITNGHRWAACEMTVTISGGESRGAPTGGP
jgi:hypothetical protein